MLNMQVSLTLLSSTCLYIKHITRRTLSETWNMCRLKSKKKIFTEEDKDKT